MTAGKKDVINTPAIIFYDLETTDADTEKCGIHQFSGLVLKDNKIVERFDWHVKPAPGCSCSPYAMYLCKKAGGPDTIKGLMESDAYEPMDVVFNRFIDLIKRYSTEGKNGYPTYDSKPILAGFNIHKFDNQVLRTWFKANGDEHGPGYYLYMNSGLDMIIQAFPYLLRYRNVMRGFTQKDVAWALGVNIDRSKLHASDYDIEVCYQIFLKVIGKNGVVSWPDDWFYTLHSDEDIKKYKDEHYADEESTKVEKEEFVKTWEDLR